MSDHPFDDLARTLAAGASRRGVLRAIGGAVLGTLVAAPPRPVLADGNADCAHFCDDVEPPGPGRGECKSDAAQQQGLCYTCGPAATAGHPDVCGVGTSSVTCCTVASPTCCGNATCVNLQSDVTNCGTCGNACKAPANASAVCTNGKCGFVCNAGFVLCQGKCVPTCPDGEVLDPTTCTCACPTGTQLCKGTCVSNCTGGLILNPTTCRCEPGQICPNPPGVCTHVQCGSGPARCDCLPTTEGVAACVNDAQSCGKPCSSTAQCAAGQVCITQCCGAGACVNLCPTPAASATAAAVRAIGEGGVSLTGG